jgi:transcriptional regulator with XRE-family HTH domain
MKLTPSQISAAMGLVGMTQEQVAHAAGIARLSLNRILIGDANPKDDTLERIKTALESRGVEFLPNEGVARNNGTIDRLTGQDALKRFFDDVYETVKSGGDLCVSGVDEKLFAKFNVSEEEAKIHRERMSAIRDKITFRALIKEGDNYFRNDSYIQYRWMPKQFFYEHPVYLYNTKLAFIKFEDNNLEIIRVTLPTTAAAFRAQFEFIWSHAKPPHKTKQAKK